MPRHILPVIVFSQFCCTSLWFAGNGVAAELALHFGMSGGVGAITSAVQIGFILGTLVFAVLKIADRFLPSRVFFFCALIGAISNLFIVWMDQPLELLGLRFATGFFLAGIYPVGMKIASDYHQKGLGLALGYLVGALVLGTAFPHLLREVSASQSWELVIYATSALSVFGGVMMFVFVPAGPFRSKSIGLDFIAFVKVFRYSKFKAVACGYLGHMWELYAFWAFVPAYLSLYNQVNSVDLPIAIWSFFIIAIGAVGCIVGGYFSIKVGSEKVAILALFTSLLSILLSPLMLYLPVWAFLLFLLIWGLAVIMDSPQFSSAAAAYAPKESTGTALTIMNCLGFALTIGSISLLASEPLTPYLFWWLLPGPFLGLLLMRKYAKEKH